MEIHPPHGSIHTWKDFLIQLGTITAGVLIALSFEGVREWRHDRALVHEARENIQRELADNKKEIDGELDQISERNKKIETALGFATEILKTKQSRISQVELGLAFPTLRSASWQTAERTGAFAHMDYAEVQKYAEVYSMQDFMQQQHRRAMEALTAAIGIITGGEGGDPTKAAPAEIERFRQQVIFLRSILLIEEQLARQAIEKYKKALE